jgi:hypothetical protein
MLLKLQSLYVDYTTAGCEQKQKIPVAVKARLVVTYPANRF